MLKDSVANRLIIKTIIAIFQAYPRFCLAYSLWVLAAKIWHPVIFNGNQFLNNTFLWAILIPDALFYIFFGGYAQYIQRAAVHPPKRSKDERLQLFTKVRSEIYDPVTFLSGWFRGARPEDIGKEELRRFLDWAFWEGRAGEDEESSDEDEIEEYIQKIEKMVPKGFSEGPGSAKSLRLTLDPIEIEPRSLLWYALIGFGDALAMTLLMLQGFRYYRLSLPGLCAVFPPRPMACIASNVSKAPDISYFHRKHTSKTRLPVLHIHGIGIGILPHVAFLRELDHALNASASEDDQVGIIALEILQVSSRLTASMPRRSEFLAQLTSVLDQHFGNERFVLVGHSYGSITSTHILNDHRLASRVAGTLLVDPVSLLLHMPDVAYNFTVRPPVRANEWLLYYFASKDPQIARTLGREFFWQENLLWRDQIDHLITNHKMRFTASLASDDLIVNTSAVRAYLTERDVPDPVLVRDAEGEKKMELQTHTGSHNEKASDPSQSRMNIIWWQDYDHAQVFDKKQDRARLIDVLVEYAKG